MASGTENEASTDVLLGSQQSLLRTSASLHLCNQNQVYKAVTVLIIESVSILWKYVPTWEQALEHCLQMQVCLFHSGMGFPEPFYPSRHHLCQRNTLQWLSGLCRVTTATLVLVKFPLRRNTEFGCRCFSPIKISRSELSVWMGGSLKK